MSRQVLLNATCETLPADELCRLVTLAQAGNIDARNRIIASTMRLVIQRANRWSGMVGRPDLRDDMVAAACAGYGGQRGLIGAVSRFDVSRGTRWSTYAMHEIDLAMRGVLTAALHDGLSRYAVMRLDAIRRCAERLAAQGIEPTIEAVQADFIRSGKKAPKAGRIWFALNGGPVDVAPEMVEPEAEAAIDTAREIAELRAAIDELPAQECDVMRMRLTGATQAEVATELRINVADVRRLEASASARLRHELG